MAGSGTDSAESGDEQYIEPSFLNALPHYSPLLVFPLLLLALFYGGWWLLGPFLFMSLASFLDPVFGADGLNMNPRGVHERSYLWYNIPVWAWAFMWPPTLVFGLWQILVANPFAIWEDVILAILLTMEAQAVFVVGHELVHRRTTWEKRVGEFLLSSASYPQYATEHVYIHHAKVGTPHDVGSAPKGESFWRYFPREVASNLTNSWKVAGEHLARRQLSRWHHSNPFWRYALGIAFWYGLVFYMGGIWAVLVFAFLGLGCVFSMKMSNYFQHYGLRRVLLPNGRWEKISPRHSWNADWKFSNWMFFKMQRHADHHSMATRIYPQLQYRADESPELPGTYGDMMNLVMRPKRWFEKMDPLVDQWRARFYPEIEDWSPYDSSISAARPDDFEAIIEIFGVAPRLAHKIERSPELLDNLNVREFTDLDLPKGFLSDDESESIARRGLARLYWTYEMSVEEMREQIQELPSTSAIETAEIVRNWSNDKAFQVGMHVIRQNLSPNEATVALSNLAEVTLETVIAATVTEFVEMAQAQYKGGVCAIVLGDLASRDVYPGVEVELLLVWDGFPNNVAKRMWRAVREVLTRLSNDNLVLSPVLRAGNYLESLSISALLDQFGGNRILRVPAISRARSIFEHGDSLINEQFWEARSKILSDWRASNPQLSTLLAPSSTEDEGFHTQRGLVNTLDRVEIAARFLHLTDRELAEQSAPTAVSVFEHIGSGSLANNTSNCRDLLCASSLVCDHDFELANLKPKTQTFIANSCGYEDYASLNAELAEIFATINVEINSIRKVA